MGKNKLKKFNEMKEMGCVFQYPWGRLQAEEFPLRGDWRSYFGNTNPIVVELGCGKGEYTVELARRHPDCNYIGVDIKGARIWRGAKTATEEGLPNAAFVRTDIELIDRFFAPGEVAEIWITFPDPQMQKTRRRLTSPRFLNLYLNILQPNGLVHLKTDSPFLFEYTRRLADENALEVEASTSDLYGSGLADPTTSIKTFYEQQWLARGKKIKLISMHLPADKQLVDIDESDIERDDYHSYARGVAQCMPSELERLRSAEVQSESASDEASEI